MSQIQVLMPPQEHLNLEAMNYDKKKHEIVLHQKRFSFTRIMIWSTIVL